ncbi:MFS transporter [Acidipropionibacterium acidipropionici]|uniref:Major facilitator superfamily (MFS) profile domain-containing protein n=1 Tax=Acidipropionibacterium acidipropionici TaxID=1748 RepID=A0AAC8YFU5_9ACTN|nr:MFS transporter [Acidipropionibacterium acidipropionici]AMS05780.1 hypothetical protein AXH35_10340 [Acidipropionibacterium acidipropionici]AOZ47246.1 hypothetical protein A8L58_11780 [Acidipropionibacterium acidipropionici]AZP36644.1 MFS transporter [Acidipropionibacterium acidipropionici]
MPHTSPHNHPDPTEPAAARPHSPLIGLALPIYVPSIIWATSYGALTAVMVLAALKVGFSPTFASLVAGLSGLVGVLTGPWIGRQTSRFGDRSAFMAGTVSAVGSLLLALVALGFPGRLWAQGLYLLAMLILSVSNNIWSLARQSYIAESVPMRWRARALSMMGGMQRMGQVIGPAVGSVAIAWWSYPGSFWAQIVLAVVAMGFVVAFTLPTPTQLAETSESGGRRRRPYPHRSATAPTGARPSRWPSRSSPSPSSGPTAMSSCRCGAASWASRRTPSTSPSRRGR